MAHVRGVEMEALTVFSLARALRRGDVCTGNVAGNTACIIKNPRELRVATRVRVLAGGPSNGMMSSPELGGSHRRADVVDVKLGVAIMALYEYETRLSLLRSILPQLAGSTVQPSVAEHVVACMEQHQLLVETLPEAGAAVDAFTQRVLALVSTTDQARALFHQEEIPGLCTHDSMQVTHPGSFPAHQEDACCAGAHLLAYLCTACALPRFVQYAEEWVTRILPTLRAAAPLAVRLAGCSAAKALVQRAAASLEAAPSLRRDVAGLLSKAVPALLTAPQAGTAVSRQLTHASLDLLLATAGGACAGGLRAHLDAVETFAASVVLDVAAVTWHGSDDACVDAAIAVLACLPRVTGDAAAWSHHARRVLLAAHASLDAAMRSCESQAAAASSRGGLDAPGEPSARPFASGSSVGQTHPSHAARLASRWLHVAASMLRAPFPVPVPFPASALHGLIARVLTCDGTPTAPVPGVRPAPSSPALLFALPGLHTDALDVLDAALASAGRQGLLMVAHMFMHTLRTALRSGVALPSSGSDGDDAFAVPPCPAVRVRLYSTVEHFLHVFGSSFAVALGPDIVHAARHDLAIPRHAIRVSSSAGDQAGGGAGSKKRKKETDANAGGATTKSILAGATPDLAAYGAIGPAGARVRAAALGALAAVCTVAAGALPETCRADLDALVAHAATSSAAHAQLPGAWDARAPDAMAERDTALSALLACVLAPRPGRSPYLPLALSLCRQGIASAPDSGRDAQLIRTCWTSMLALEALIHPVAPPRALRATMAEPSSHVHGAVQISNNGQALPRASGVVEVQPADAAPPRVLFAPPNVAVNGTAAPQAEQTLEVKPPAQEHSVRPPPLALPQPQQAVAPVRKEQPAVRATPPAAQPAPLARAVVAKRTVADQVAMSLRGGDSDSEGPLPDIVMDDEDDA